MIIKEKDIKYIIDRKGNKKGVQLNYNVFKELIEKLEDIEDIKIHKQRITEGRISLKEAEKTMLNIK